MIWQLFQSVCLMWPALLQRGDSWQFHAHCQWHCGQGKIFLMEIYLRKYVEGSGVSISFPDSKTTRNTFCFPDVSWLDREYLMLSWYNLNLNRQNIRVILNIPRIFWIWKWIENPPPSGVFSNILHVGSVVLSAVEVPHRWVCYTCCSFPVSWSPA